MDGVDLRIVDSHGQSVVVGQRDLGADVDFGGEDELVAVSELGDLDLGVAEDVDVVLADGLAVQARQRVVDNAGEALDDINEVTDAEIEARERNED